MRHKDLTSSRLIYLRELLDLSQRDFSESIGITQGALSHLETGKSQLSFESMQKICKTFKINCNWLIGETENPIFIETQMNVSQSSSKKTKKSHAESGFSDSSLIPLILEEAHAGYIKNCGDLDYISTLDVYRIPGFEKGDYRLFEVQGDSMIPSILPREIIVAEFIQNWSEIENGTLVIAISEEDIVVKRCYFYEDKAKAILKSDNPSYKTYSLPLEDIKELWEVKAKITHVFAEDPIATAEEFQSMQKDIAHLKTQMQSLKGENIAD